MLKEQHAVIRFVATKLYRDEKKEFNRLLIALVRAVRNDDANIAAKCVDGIRAAAAIRGRKPPHD